MWEMKPQSPAPSACLLLELGRRRVRACRVLLPRATSANAGLCLSPFQVDTLCLEDLHAFIAQALCLQGKSAVQLEALQVLT